MCLFLIKKEENQLEQPIINWHFNFVERSSLIFIAKGKNINEQECGFSIYSKLQLHFLRKAHFVYTNNAC